MRKERGTQMKENTLKVKEKNTLQKFLNQEGYAKNKVKSLLKYENVWVNGKVEKKYDFLLKPNDVVTITNHRKVAVPFQIIYEDQEFLVINKKEKLRTTSTDKKERNLYQQALYYLKEKGTKEKLFVIQQLEKEASGIVIFCKDQLLATHLQKSWDIICRKKISTAVIEGQLSEKEGTLVFYLQEHGQKNVIITDSKHGQKAITNYKVLEENNKYTLVELETKTNRKNQIRATLSHITHPVLGDKKYYSKENPIHRLALVTNYIEFRHPITHKVYKFEIEVPKDFKKIVK